MKNTLKTMLAVMSLTVALSACGSKPAETTETKDSVVTAPADSTPVASDTTAVDSAAVAK
jgi:predicted small lipoprotein YifL